MSDLTNAVWQALVDKGVVLPSVTEEDDQIAIQAFIGNAACNVFSPIDKGVAGALTAWDNAAAILSRGQG